MYAKGTTVPIEKSRNEIEQILIRYGANQFIAGWDSDKQAMVSFRIKERFVKIMLPLPDRQKVRSQNAWDQLCRSRWRALLLVIKAKLEAVASGITSVEDEFMADIVLPEGQTVKQWLKPQIALAYEKGGMPKTLPGLPAPSPVGK